MPEALSLTWETLNARVRLHKLAVIGSLILLAAAAAAAAIFRTAWALAGIAALYPWVCLALYLDMRKVFAWEDGVLRLWADGALDLGVFVQALEMKPSPLKRSLLGMTRVLPREAAAAGPGAPRRPYRALAAARRAAEETRFLRACGFGSAVFWVVLAALAARAHPLRAAAGLAAAIAFPLAVEFAIAAVRRAWAARLDASGPYGPAEFRELAGRIAGLDWKGVPERHKARILAVLARREPGKSAEAIRP
jgi:hypothetical protein